MDIKLFFFFKESLVDLVFKEFISSKLLFVLIQLSRTFLYYYLIFVKS